MSHSKDRRLFLGIDGGGTITKGVVCDEEGHVLARAESGSINYYGVGLAKARENLSQLLSALQVKVPQADYRAVVIGSSALDREATPAEVTQMVGNLFPETTKVAVNSDAYIALYAFTEGKPGLLVISGTGSIILAQPQNGDLVVHGGWGHLLGDEGSAYAVGRRGIMAAIRDHDGWGQETQLVPAVLDFFAIANLRQLIDVVYQPDAGKDTVAAFAPVVDANAVAGDVVSTRIITEEAVRLARQVEAAYGRLDIPTAPIGVTGGLFTNSQLFAKTFLAACKDRHPRVPIKVPPYPAEMGAVMLAIKLCGISSTGRLPK